MESQPSQSDIMDVLKHILFLLNVKFTSTFLRKLYMENPNNTNLLGFSNMLRFYGIDTQPGKITNKETFENEIIPFLTKLHDDFVVVVEDCKDNKYKVFSDIYTYIEKDTFLKIWDGTFLAFEKTPQSCEPQYENHRKEEKSKKIFTILGYGSLLILCLLCFWLIKRFLMGGNIIFFFIIFWGIRIIWLIV